MQYEESMKPQLRDGGVKVDYLADHFKDMEDRKKKTEK